MKKDRIISKNMDLLSEFMKYSFDFPDILDQIPENAELVILPENDSEMYRENMKIVKRLQKEGQSFVIIKMKRPEPVPTPLVEVVGQSTK